MGAKSKGKGSAAAGHSKKSAIIEHIFHSRWNARSGTLEDPVVTFKDISAAINVSGTKLSTSNPANFFKDFIRNKASANRNWPKSVFASGYTGDQLTGGSKCFQFTPVENGQTEPFPLLSFAYPKSSKAPRHLIQSVSLSPFWRLLGRRDETWLIQVLVRLNLVQTHFALFSKTGLRHVEHLQTAVRQTRVEIDALFLGEGVAAGQPKRALITLEGKGAKDDILEEQIIRQIEAVVEMKSIRNKFDVVIPVAAKVLGKSEIYVVEYEEIKPTAKPPYKLEQVMEVIYCIVPHVEGVL
jgi:hypothetical protein